MITNKLVLGYPIFRQTQVVESIAEILRGEERKGAGG